MTGKTQCKQQTSDCEYHSLKQIQSDPKNSRRQMALVATANSRMVDICSSDGTKQDNAEAIVHHSFVFTPHEPGMSRGEEMVVGGPEGS